MTEKQLKELKARANLAEHELSKLQLEKSAFESIKQSLKDEISSLTQQVCLLNQKLLEQQSLIHRQNKSISDLQNSSSDSSREQQKVLQNLKNSLLEMESLVAYRASTSKKFLSKLLRLVNSFSQSNSEPGPSFRVNLKKFSREIVTCVEDLGKIINSNAKLDPDNDEFKETIREKDSIIEEYRLTLEKMREQMMVMREKLKENDGRKGIDSEKKVRSLIMENENLNKKIRGLEESLREQSEFVTSLKDVFVNTGDEQKIIDDELALVDQEIVDLQSSLSRALAN